MQARLGDDESWKRVCVTNTDSLQCSQFFGGSDCSNIEMKNNFHQRPDDPTEDVYIARLASDRYLNTIHVIVDESVVVGCSYLNQVDLTCSCGEFKMIHMFP